MPAPPMNDVIILLMPAIDSATGEIAKDKYGRELTNQPTVADARVAYTAELIVNQKGEQVEAKLEIDLPTTQEVYVGINVEWVDRFGNEVQAVIEAVEEVLNYSGKKVYWRKCYAT